MLSSSYTYIAVEKESILAYGTLMKSKKLIRKVSAVHVIIVGWKFFYESINYAVIGGLYLQQYLMNSSGIRKNILTVANNGKYRIESKKWLKKTCQFYLRALNISDSAFF